MLYILIICIIVCIFVCANKMDFLDYLADSVGISITNDLYIKSKRHLHLVIIFLVFFIISAVIGTVIMCNSDFLTPVEQSSNTYQVTDFSAERSTYNLIGDYEIKYTITVEENFKIVISSKDYGTEIICDNYNPKTVTVEESHCFKWWFLCPYDTYTYTLS